MRTRTAVLIVLGFALAVLLSWLEYRHGMDPSMDDVALGWSLVRPGW
jgi:cation transporter-like permease